MDILNDNNCREYPTMDDHATAKPFVTYKHSFLLYRACQVFAIHLVEENSIAITYLRFIATTHF